MLDDFVYKKIWTGLSEQDKNVIIASGDNKSKVSEVCERLKMTSSTFSKYRERLLNRGLIQSTAHGYVELSLPRFAAVTKAYL